MSVRVTSGLRGWMDAVLGLFYPNVCQICGEHRALPSEGFVCPACWSRPGGLRFIVPPFCDRCGLPFDGEISGVFECGNCRDRTWHFTSARAAVVAEGLVREVVHRYKYHRALWFEPFLTDILVRQATPVLPAAEWDRIVPVPLHPVKQREREFNQAERLARRLGAATGIPVETGWLARVQSTGSQTTLTRAQRAENVKDAFAFRGGDDIAGMRVVLVDDVFTTGATTNACAAVLRKMGADRVCVWTVARGT